MDEFKPLHGGYAPLSVRLAQAAVKGPWKAIEESLKALPGPHFEYTQGYDEDGAPAVLPANYAGMEAKRAAVAAASATAAGEAAAAVAGAAAAAGAAAGTGVSSGGAISSSGGAGAGGGAGGGGAGSSRGGGGGAGAGGGAGRAGASSSNSGAGSGMYCPPLHPAHIEPLYHNVSVIL